MTDPYARVALALRGVDVERPARYVPSAAPKRPLRRRGVKSVRELARLRFGALGLLGRTLGLAPKLATCFSASLSRAFASFASFRAAASSRAPLRPFPLRSALRGFFSRARAARSARPAPRMRRTPGLEVVGQPAGSERRPPFFRRGACVQRLGDSLERLIRRGMPAFVQHLRRRVPQPAHRVALVPPRPLERRLASAAKRLLLGLLELLARAHSRRRSTSRRRASWFTAHAGHARLLQLLDRRVAGSFAIAFRAAVNSSSGSAYRRSISSAMSPFSRTSLPRRRTTSQPFCAPRVTESGPAALSS